MFVLLLLLGACFCVGLSYDMLLYGDDFRMRLSSRAQYTEFISSKTGETSIIWKRGEPPRDSRLHVTYFFKLKNVTQKDNGRYIQRDINGREIIVRDLQVEARTFAFKRKAGSDFSFTYDLQPSSCNIYFHPEHESRSMDELVHQGSPQYSRKCQGFEVLRPCGIIFNSLTVSCDGHFSIRDSNGNTALEVSLEVEASGVDTKKIGMGFGITFAILSCCGCLKRTCCGKSKKEDSETPENEDPPPVYYHECDNNDPNGPEPDPFNPLSETPYPSQPPDTTYPSQPSYTQTGPLIHEPPTTLPPSYFEVFGETEPACLSSASNSEPRFELRGMSIPSASPLGLNSASASDDVYTSDKLNFLSKP